MNIDQQTIDTIRVLSAEMVEKANSGHPGLPLGAAPMAHTLWSKAMKHNPKNPNWIDRDRFVLSAGHGSALIYSLLHLYEYGLTIDDLKEFRQLDSNTPGHPEYGDTIGVEATTGPLGQGIAMGVGMAMAEAHLAAKFNTEDIDIIDHYTYLLSGDGCLMEGISNEAASLAGTLGLGKLIILYDSNDITIEGSTDLAFNEDVRGRFEALGWETILVEDGNDIVELEKAMKEAKANTKKPSLIEIRTKIGYGTLKEGKAAAHGAPLGQEAMTDMRSRIKWENDEFHVSDEVREYMSQLAQKGQDEEENWNKKLEDYKEKYPELAAELKKWFELELPMDYLESDDFWSFDKDTMSTRSASGELINRIADRVPNFFGGSADLGPSNLTTMKNREAFSVEDYTGSNIHFGVREHAMAAAINGISLHGGVRPYAGTFFIFTDYMKPAMRLSSLMKQPVTHVLTHDSIGVGEDGPTHQPIEQLAVFRAQPNFITYRPADAVETAAGWYTALTSEETPVGLVLTRQNLPVLEGTGKDALKGGYVLRKENKDLELILIATGSEVQLAVEAAKALEEKNIGVRVVSMPSVELFEDQPAEYKEEVLPKDVRKRVAIEAASSFGWHKYVGLDGKIIAIDGFGASAPAGKLFEKYGITVDNLVNTALELF